MKRFLLYVSIILLLTAGIAAAADQKLLEIGADYRFRIDALQGTVPDHMLMTTSGAVPQQSFEVKNHALLLDRLGLNLKANVAEDLTVKARLVMYKVWGNQTMQPVQGSFFADRVAGPYDGIVSHVPTDSELRVDTAYATWSNVGGVPLWIAAGRRPTTGGVPTNLKQNLENVGVEGFPGIMIDYAFDGATIGYQPGINSLPGAYAKVSYGKGFDSGYNTTLNTLKDTEYLGLNVVPYVTDTLNVDLQVQKGFHLADRPADITNLPNNNQQPIDPNNPYVTPSDNVGDILWWGGAVTGKVGDINLFASAAQSKTQPNNHSVNGLGLLWDSNDPQANRTGNAIYIGGRYDIKSTGTKIGLEYNQGSKYWIGMVPAADDIWTSKLGTRGKVYEVYLIQELQNKPLMKKAKAFWKFGYQLYKFDYTGSSNWMGAPVKISELDMTTTSNAQYLTPIKEAEDFYLTFEVLF